MRIFMLLLAYAALAAAIAGLFLPILPTVPFLLLAGWAASRSSPRLDHWLQNHPRFGPSLRDWRQNRRVSRRAKWAATLGMAASAAMATVLVQQRLVLAVAFTAMALVLAWLWARPEPPRNGRSGASEP